MRVFRFVDETPSDLARACLAIVAVLSCAPPQAVHRVNQDESATDAGTEPDGDAPGRSPTERPADRPLAVDAASSADSENGDTSANVALDAPPSPVDVTPSPVPSPDAGTALADAPTPIELDAGAPPSVPILMVSYSAGVARTDLTATGSLDWVHWGYRERQATTRKANVSTPLITMRELGSASLGRYTDRPVHFAWSDGSPTAIVTDTPDGVDRGSGLGNGFRIRVAGSVNRPRTLKLFIGAWQAAATLTAQLGDTTYSDSSLDATAPGADRIYTIVFQPSTATQTLTVDWTLKRTNTLHGANVTLQAAALSQ